MLLTKTDFLLYLKAPLHLWAKVNNKLEKVELTAYEKHLIKQGYEVEKYVKDLIPYATWQTPYVTDEYEVRQDATVVFDDGTANLYEVKSSTEVKKEHLYDVTFQVLATEETQKIKKVYVVTLNKDYKLKGKIDIKNLFSVSDVTREVNNLKPIVKEKMLDALNVVNLKSKVGIKGCLNPKTCPCKSICFKKLPKKSIFNIPYLSYQKKRELVDNNILDIKDLPESVYLNPMQQKIKNAIVTNIAYKDKEKLKEFLNSFSYPIYFLDYETYPLSIPIYDNYKPYQQMVFQYSLHIVDNNSNITHKEFLETKATDPAVNLLKKLKEDIKDTGSIVVWNKQFESTRNTEMGTIYPEYKEFLENLNTRMIDLADFINKEMYIHPKFLGSWSIKNVLPVMVPELSYKNLKINKGDIAMLTWWKMVNKKDKKEAKDLLEYCKLDTLAMVKIWEKLKTLI